MSDIPARVRPGDTWPEFEGCKTCGSNGPAGPEPTERDLRLLDWPDEPVDRLVRKTFAAIAENLTTDPFEAKRVIQRAELLASGRGAQAVLVSAGDGVPPKLAELLAPACELVAAVAHRRALLLTLLHRRPDLVVVAMNHLPDPMSESLKATLRELVESKVVPVVVLGGERHRVSASELFEQIDEPEPGTEQAREAVAAIRRLMNRHDEPAR